MDKWGAIALIGISFALCASLAISDYTNGEVAASCNNLKSVAIAASKPEPKCVK